MEIPAGSIPAKEPRPLKPSELKKLRARAGGDATAGQLAALEAKFAREDKQRAATTAAIKQPVSECVKRWGNPDLNPDLRQQGDI